MKTINVAIVQSSTANLTEKQSVLAAFILQRIAENGGHTMSYEFGASEITDALGYEYFHELNPTMIWLQNNGLVGSKDNGEVWLTSLGEQAYKSGLKSFRRKEALKRLSHSKWFQIAVTVALAVAGWLTKYIL